MTAEVKNCTVQECYYNAAEICHAGAIQVGSSHPACDTFITQYDQHAAPSPIARVGACHEADCKFNHELTCHSASINVDHHDSHADCVTFAPIPFVEEEIDVPMLDETEETTYEGSANVRVMDEKYVE